MYLIHFAYHFKMVFAQYALIDLIWINMEYVFQLINFAMISILLTETVYLVI